MIELPSTGNIHNANILSSWYHTFAPLSKTDKLIETLQYSRLDPLTHCRGSPIFDTVSTLPQVNLADIDTVSATVLWAIVKALCAHWPRTLVAACSALLIHGSHELVNDAIRGKKLYLTPIGYQNLVEHSNFKTQPGNWILSHQKIHLRSDRSTE